MLLQQSTGKVASALVESCLRVWETQVFPMFPLRNAERLTGRDVDRVEPSAVTKNVLADHVIVHFQDVWHGRGASLATERF
jgi:hypothetical protein